MGIFGNKPEPQVINKSGIDHNIVLKLIRARLGNINQASVRGLFHELARHYSNGYRFDENTRKALIYYVNEIIKFVAPKINSNPNLRTLIGNDVNKMFDKISEMRWIKENRAPNSSELEKCGNFLYDILVA